MFINVVSPFYSGDDDICSDGTDDNNEPVCIGIGDNNSILTPFLISSAFIGAVFILMIWLYFVNITEKIKEDNQESADEREEDSLGDLWQYFIPVILFYFCIVSGENVYQSNIFSVSFDITRQFLNRLQYAACKVGWENGKASILNSIFWAGFGIGRGSGIFFRYLHTVQIVR
jgi:fucose permease